MTVRCIARRSKLGKGKVAALVAGGAVIAGAAATLRSANQIIDKGLAHLPVIARDEFYERYAETMPGSEGLQYAEDRKFIAEQVKEAQAHLYAEASVERVTIPAATPSQKVVAYLYQPKQPSTRWAVLAHGYQGDHYDMDGIADAYVRNGFNVLSCDLRGHGESAGAYVGLGALEASDLPKWVGYIQARFGDDCQIVLHGQGLGAAASLIAAADGVPPQVKAVVADSAYTSALAIVRRAALRAKKPGDVLAAALRASMLVRAHIDLGRSDALAAVKRNDVPTLFLHGGSDTVVPSSMAVELYTKAVSELRDLRIIPGAGHTGAFAKDSDAYSSAVREFLTQAGVSAE